MCPFSLAVWMAVALAASNETVLDQFSYGDAAAARRQWVSSGGTPDVAPVARDGRQLLAVPTPFAAQPDLPRTIIDRSIKLDLSVPGEFALEIYVEDPQPIGQVNIYFRSGSGWYGAGTGLVRQGWQTLRYSKASFRTEGQPRGWQSIDGVRISFWRGRSADGQVLLGRLSACWHDVAIVLPSPAGQGGEDESARDAAESMAAMLAELGVQADGVDEQTIAQTGLKRHRLAVLAYNPRLSADTVDALTQFACSGGKVFVAYNLPPRLGEALGFGRSSFYRPRRPGELAEIRFQGSDIAAMPPAVNQASWNITTAEPTGFGAKVIGRWFDASGRATGLPAMLISQRGAMFSHLVLGDDRERKKQLLAAVLGNLYPPLWKAMAAGEIERIGHVGRFNERTALVAHLATAQAKVAPALAQARLADSHFAADEYVPAVAAARQARLGFVDAYLEAAASPAVEGRAWWNHSGTGAYDGDWERTAKELQAAGFNMVLPNMLWGGRAHYASDVLPRSSTFEKYGDQVAQCVAAAQRHGLEVHVWKVNWNLSGAPSEFVARMRREGRTQMTTSGQAQDWLCPSHPANFELELASMLEVARKYDIDGLHFDYIRYPGAECCYCNGCRQRFEAASGQHVERWPDDCTKGSLRALYQPWRRAQVTRLVEAVSREAKKIRPAIKISAAVFGSYPSCVESVGQDWALWVERGYLDFLCPMDYTESDLAFTALVSNQLALVGGRIPIYPGIGATASRSSLAVDRVVGQIEVARSLGAGGFTIFNLSSSTARDLLGGLSRGATATPASPR